MTMNEKKLIILTHGNLAFELVESLKLILDFSDEIISSSNKEYSLEELLTFLEECITPNKDYFIFTDFPGGSCFLAAKKISSKKDNVVTISGVNLAMLTSFISKQNTYSFQELADIIIKDGKRAII